MLVNKKLLFNCVLLVLSISCQTLEKSELKGIWSLREVNIDGLDRTFEPTFIEMQPDDRFALSTTSGDFVGIYGLNDSKLVLKSNDERWFNTNWKIKKVENSLRLSGLDTPHKTTHLRFVKIKSIPDFQSFENDLVGRWELYKIRTKGNVERLNDTWFTLNSKKTYTITKSDSLVEEGHVTVDTRHKKIIFENDETSWRIWYFGTELRLENEKMDVQYSLRK